MSISHVDALLVSGSDPFIAFSSERLEKEFGVTAFEGRDAIYLRFLI